VLIYLLPGIEISNAYLLPETQICPVILHQRNWKKHKALSYCSWCGEWISKDTAVADISLATVNKSATPQWWWLPEASYILTQVLNHGGASYFTSALTFLCLAQKSITLHLHYQVPTCSALEHIYNDHKDSELISILPCGHDNNTIKFHMLRNYNVTPYIVSFAKIWQCWSPLLFWK
jgi:hypothetical protein